MLGLSNQVWTEAQSRYPVLAPLAAQREVMAAEARAVTDQLVISSRTIYVMIVRFRAAWGRSRISAKVDDIVTDTIYDTYLTREKRRIVRGIEKVQLSCRTA